MSAPKELEMCFVTAMFLVPAIVLGTHSPQTLIEWVGKTHDTPRISAVSGELVGNCEVILLVTWFTPFHFITKAPQKLPCCDMLCGEADASRNHGILTLTAVEELNASNNHVSKESSGSSWAEPWDDLGLGKRPEPGDPAQPCLGSDLQELWEDRCCFRPLSYGVICHTTK